MTGKWRKRLESFDPDTLMKDVIDVSAHRIWKPAYLNQTVGLTIRKADRYNELWVEGKELGLEGIKLVDYCVDRVARIK